MKNLVVTLICLFALSSLHAQQINLKPGDEFAIQTRNTETNIKTNKLVNDEAYTFQFKMLKTDTAGYKLECILLKAREWEENAWHRINSDSLKSVQLNSSEVLTPLILLQKPFTVIISQRGKFIRTEGVTELVNQTMKHWHLDEDLQQYIPSNIDIFLKGKLMELFFELPEEKLNYQSTWTNSETKTTYKVTAIRSSLLDIMPVNQDKEHDSKFLLNDVNGLIENATSTYTQTNIANAKSYYHTRDLVYGKGVASVVDTAWINMAMTLSLWSDALKNKANELDSTKAFTYFKAHDPLFGNDKYYTLGKLRLANSLRSETGFKVYQDMLRSAPNKFLAGNQVQLFNKIQAVHTENADTAFNVIKYFYKEPEFERWVHQDFAQYFIDTPSRVTVTLLAMLNADKGMGLQPMLASLSLWVNAKDGNHSNGLSIAYSKFMHMNDLYLRKGDGSRYALLTYKLLVSAKKQDEADKLLDRITKKLEEFTTDTLNKNRFADKNMLAYACYLKYQQINKTDSVAALQYLKKASGYSPANKNEKTYTSFYDRAFLGSAESYHDEYIDKLFAGGNTEEALKIFADEIMTDPAKLPDIQNSYQKRFAGKSFKDFFINNVVSKWEDAPSFELTGLDGKKRALADYKNKWLVIDFWGTWCGPCREEMPKVNAFNQELTEGKLVGVNLLSIACGDTETAVKKYITGKNFGITVLMSDQIVQKKYKIGGYPSKILISPNGKMIDIEFGTDWQDIVKKFSELYAAN